MPNEWDNFPPTNFSTDVCDFDYLIQIWKAIQERYDIPGAPDAPHAFPGGSTPYDIGVITSATDDGSTWTITDNTVVDGNPVHNWDNDSKPFTTGPNDDWAASSYDVVFFLDPDDTRKIVRAHITANTSDTLTFADQTDEWITLQKIITGVSDLVGKPFVVVDHRWIGSWAEAWPEVPTTFEYVWGQNNKAFTVTVTASTTFTLTAGATTDPIAKDGSAADVQAALTAKGIEAFVRGGGPFTVLFKTDVTLTASGATVTQPTGHLYDYTQSWEEEYWTTSQPDLAGSPTAFDLICQDNGGAWRRVAITDNDDISLTFSAGSWTLGLGDYYIVARDGWWRADRRLTYDTFQWVDGKINQFTGVKAWPIYCWYRGLLDSYISHTPTDTLGGFNVALETLERASVGDVEGECDSASDPALDNYIRNGDQDVCTGESRKIWCPNLYKTLRGAQLASEQLLGIGSWIERKDYTNFAAIPVLNPAIWFKLFLPNANWVSTTISDATSGVASISVTLPTETGQAGAYSSMYCIWAMVEANGDVTVFSPTAKDNVVTSSTLTASAYSFVGTADNPDVNDAGKTIIVVWGGYSGGNNNGTAGWTRYFERRFQRLFHATYMEPDLADGGGAADVDPDNPGTFVTVNPSSEYAEANEYGLVSDTRAFVTGEAARFIGSAPPTTDAKETNALLSWEDKIWVGRPGLATGWFRPTTGGAVTSANTTSLTCATAQYWEANGYLHSLTAADGSTTTITADSGIDNTTPMYDGTRRDFVSFTIKFTSGLNNGQKRLVTGYTPSTKTFAFAPALAHPVLAADTAAIQEPKYVLNHWKDHRVTISFNGETHVETITANDTTTIFFAAVSYTIPTGATFAIDEPEVGTVWQRKPSAPADHQYNGWVLTSDANATADTRGHAWKSTAISNSPTLVKAFGRIRFMDLPICGPGGGAWKQLYDGINKLVWWKESPTWNDKGENNWNVGGGGGSDVSLHNDWSDAHSQTTASWPSGKANSEFEGFPPNPFSYIEEYNYSEGSPAGAVVNAYAEYNYMGTHVYRIAAKVEGWVFCTFDSGDSDVGTFTSGDSSDVRTFDENGPLAQAGSALKFRAWSKAFTTTALNADVSVKIGSTDSPPAFPTDPPDSPQITYRNGAYVQQALIIKKFNVTNGLKYTDTSD